MSDAKSVHSLSSMIHTLLCPNKYTHTHNRIFIYIYPIFFLFFFRFYLAHPRYIYIQYIFYTILTEFLVFVFNIQTYNDYTFSLLPPKSLILIASPLPRTCGRLVSFVMFCKFIIMYYFLTQNKFHISLIKLVTFSN